MFAVYIFICIIVFYKTIQLHSKLSQVLLFLMHGVFGGFNGNDLNVYNNLVQRLKRFLHKYIYTKLYLFY